MTIVTFLDHLPAPLENRMRDGLGAYETKAGIDVNYKQFALVIAPNQGEIVGVLNAYTAFTEVYVSDLWVDASARGQGYGKKLLDALYNHFEGQGFNNINLCTSAFQAPKFYEKCGFTLEFIRLNKTHPQFNKFFFVKYFTNTPQLQGLLRTPSDAEVKETNV